MDHQQQQQHHPYRYQYQQPQDGPTMTAPVQSPISPPSKPTLPANQLSALEEFAIGCLSGVAGAGVAWFHLTGWTFVFYAMVVPWLVLELMESYALFCQVSRRGGGGAAYATVQQCVVARKRVARQLFGQGVIMGSAGMEITSPEFQFTQNPRSLLVGYAIVWLLWMLLCQYIQMQPTHDQISNQLEKQKQQQVRLKRLNRPTTTTKTTVRRSKSTTASNSSKSGNEIKTISRWPARSLGGSLHKLWRNELLLRLEEDQSVQP